MINTSQTSRKAILIPGAGIGLCTALAASFVLAQGVAVTPTTSNSASSQEIQALKARLELLEQRVEDLEEEGSDVIEAGGAEDAEAIAKKVEQRLATLEKNLAERKGDPEPNSKSNDTDEDEPFTVRAPFVVRDDEGHTLFRVDVPPDLGGARIVIGNPVGTRLTMIAADDDVTTFTMRDSGNKLRIALQGSGSDADVTGISVHGQGTAAEFGETSDKRFGLFLYRGDIGSVTLTSRSTGSGYLALTNSSGAIVAEGGSKENGIGIFRTGPSCCLPPGAMGPHQYIVGKPD
jgi:hypothetical protein